MRWSLGGDNGCVINSREGRAAEVSGNGAEPTSKSRLAREGEIQLPAGLSPTF